MMATLVDIHTHILPAVDDGAANTEIALQMANAFVAAGTSALFATPHGYSPVYHVHTDVIRTETKRFNQALKVAQIPLTVRPGMEIRYHADVITHLLASDALCLGAVADDKIRYALIELPTREWPKSLPDTIYKLNLRNITSIIAHPERNLAAQKNDRIVDAALTEGALLQVTAASVMGNFGTACERTAHRLLAAGKVHFVASDAHDSTLRTPGLRSALDHIRTAWKLTAAADRCIAMAEHIWDETTHDN